jgi:hypothetical protein
MILYVSDQAKNSKIGSTFIVAGKARAVIILENDFLSAGGMILPTG